MGIVYIHDNYENSKVYVGQTWNKGQRELDHRNPSNKSLFAAAIGVHGWDGFGHYYSDEIECQDKLDDLEKMWILLLQATDATCGYNRRFGGSRGQHTKATKLKLKDARRLQGPPSESGRLRISLRHRGNTYNVGRKPSLEARAKISKAGRGKVQEESWVNLRVLSRKLTMALREALGVEYKKNFGRVVSSETLTKMSNSHRGKKASSETRRKMSEARRRFFSSKLFRHP